jgi:hypothetical protein
LTSDIRILIARKELIEPGRHIGMSQIGHKSFIAFFSIYRAVNR